MLKIKKLALMALIFITYQLSASQDQQLLEAALNGEIFRVKELINANADINTTNMYGKTALILAAENGYTEIVQELLDRGAKVNAIDNYGNTALILAAYYRHTEIVRALLAHGVEVNTKDNRGDTALMWAAENGNIEIVRALLARGGEVNASDIYGITALTWAAIGGHIEIVRTLLVHGAEVNTADKYGRTALSSATESRNAGIIELLTNYESLQQQINDAMKNNIVISDEVLKNILTNDFAPLLRQILSPELIIRIYGNHELKSLIKEQVTRLFQEYKDPFLALSLIRESPELENTPWEGLSPEIIAALSSRMLLSK